MIHPPRRVRSGERRPDQARHRITRRCRPASGTRCETAVSERQSTSHAARRTSRTAIPPSPTRNERSRSSTPMPSPTSPASPWASTDAPPALRSAMVVAQASTPRRSPPAVGTRPSTASTNRSRSTPARELAASAGVGPGAHAAASVLELGRAARLLSRAQKVALVERDGGCAWPALPAPSLAHPGAPHPHGGHATAAPPTSTTASCCARTITTVFMTTGGRSSSENDEVGSSRRRTSIRTSAPGPATSRRGTSSRFRTWARSGA